ncbi:hypothetical protein SSS_04424 [Sarcoptes scabiei]|uniref:ZP domain-containing protein n=1 Tax=Sarcoptes scabiei TaxID=52283 RepID=A0A834VCM7_SARSC|nr:hypothetical protein SSS_04424 [Sarcoptes scabiei]
MNSRLISTANSLLFKIIVAFFVSENISQHHHHHNHRHNNFVEAIPKGNLFRLVDDGNEEIFASNPYIPLTSLNKDINYLALKNDVSKYFSSNGKFPISSSSSSSSSQTKSQSSSRFSSDTNSNIDVNHHQSSVQVDNNEQNRGQRARTFFQSPPHNFKIINENNHHDQINNNNVINNNLIETDLQTDSTTTNSNPQQPEQWLTQQSSSFDRPKMTNLDVKCDKNSMKVSINFDKPFQGIIFSKGHYNYRDCVYLLPNSNIKKLFFDVSINSCGTTGNAQGTYYNEDVSPDNAQFFENTIIIQYDPQVQEVWDQVRKIRCTWHDQYEKSVSFRPFPVDMLDVVRADFAGDNVGCWMQIQVGKGPWASEVAGIVKIGQTMTMVLAIKDEENKFDMLVRNCIAHDGKRSPIELVDSSGCVMRPKLMSKFTKIKNFGSSASVLSYTHFQAFKFPDSMEVHFQCTIQICRYQCPDQCTKQSQSADVINLYNNNDMEGVSRQKRSTIIRERVVSGRLPPITNDQSVGLERAIQVVSPRDLSFSLSTVNSERLIDSDDESEQIERSEDHNLVCMTAFSFIIALTSTGSLCLFCSIYVGMLCKKNRHLSYHHAKTIITN